MHNSESLQLIKNVVGIIDHRFEILVEGIANSHRRRNTKIATDDAIDPQLGSGDVSWVEYLVKICDQVLMNLVSEGISFSLGLLLSKVLIIVKKDKNTKLDNSKIEKLEKASRENKE